MAKDKIWRVGNELNVDFNNPESVAKEINAQRGRAQVRLFEAAYPDVDVNELFGDREFMEYTKKTCDPLITAYEVYMGQKSTPSPLSEERHGVSTGSVRSSGRASQAAYFTRDEVMSMTPSQVRKNLDKIHKSIPKWKV